jgi:hypothetical protein
MDTSAFGRSRPAADAAREVVERWLLYGCDVSVGHRRFPYDPFAKNDVGRTPEGADRRFQTPPSRFSLLDYNGFPVLHGRISSSLLQTRNSRKHSRCLQKFPSFRTPVSSGESGRLVTRAQDSLEMPILFQKR